MPADTVVAIAAGDIHLSHTPPRYRSVEPDWYATQTRCLNQLKEACLAAGNVPLLLTGDLFDTWDQPHSVVAMAAEALKGLAIVLCAGNHDLPNHSMSEFKRSALHSFCLQSNVSVTTRADQHIIACPFHFNDEKALPEFFEWKLAGHQLKIALVHKYVWQASFKHPGATQDSHVGKLLRALEGFDVVLTGDNHQEFNGSYRGMTYANCGTAMRRHSNEREYRPCYFEIRRSGHLRRCPFDTEADQYLELEETPEPAETATMEQIVESLESIHHQDDLQVTVESLLRKLKTKPIMRKLVYELLDLTDPTT